MSLERYDNLDYYEYRKVRKQEKSKTRSKTLTSEEALKAFKQSEARELVWKYLLDTQSKESAAFQDYYYHAYQPKPHPDDKAANEAQILILESQRRFLQMIDRSIIPGQDVYHLDLSSAYLTALANVKHSLKYNMKYPLNLVNEPSRSANNIPIHHYVVDDLFNIVRVRLEMPYDSRINIFAPNNKIVYKGKIISETNFPDYGETVQVRMELFVSKKYNIDSWVSFTTIFKDYDIEYKKVDVFTYDYIDRNQIYDLEDARLLLEEMSTYNKEDKSNFKTAIVSFTGQLINIDPGRRLIMLALNEEVMRRMYIILSRHTTVYGLQIDGMYFEPFDWPAYANPADIVYELGKEIYGAFPPKLTKDKFSKLELWDSTKYAIKPFRIQEVR